MRRSRRKIRKRAWRRSPRSAERTGNTVDTSIYSSSAGSGFGAGASRYGQRGGFGASFAASALDGSNGFIAGGANSSDRAGTSVAGAGDVNGDGLADLLIGAPEADPRNRRLAGVSYLVFGRRGVRDTEIDLGELDGSDGFTLSGAADNDSVGRAVASAGDVTGDGIDDFLVSAPEADSGGFTQAGVVYVVHGRRGGFGAVIELNRFANRCSGDVGFGKAFCGSLPAALAGTSMAGAGDVNGDGVDDIIIGAYRASFGSGRTRAGGAYIVFGENRARVFSNDFE